MDWDKATSELKKKLHPSAVSTRTQNNITLSYVEAHYAIRRANDIFGFDGWTRETVENRCVSEREAKIGKYQKDGWRVTYVAKVRVVAGGVLKEGTGAGHGIDVDLGQAHESAVKEAESDAMKRALMLFGDQFGLALYDKAKAHVGIDHEPEAQKPAPQSITPQQEAALSDLFKNLGESGERMKHQLLEKQRIEKLGDLSARLFEDVHSRLMKVQKPQGGADAA